MTLFLVALSARGENEVTVVFELREGDHCQRESFSVSTALVADLHLKVGECSRECFDAVAEASERYRAVKKGLYLLGFGACSRRMLCRKLTDKGFSRTIAEAAVDELSEMGYLDDGAGAFREAEICVNKCWGRRRIAATLYQKGYSDASVREALFRLEDNGVDFVELCVRRIRQGSGVVPSAPDEKRKEHHVQVW